MKQNSPIGILDSGVGGLSVWLEISRLLPQEQTLYIADSANAPYGSKTNDEVFILASKLIKFLLTQDVKIIVAACNTITVSCIDQLRQTFPEVEIIGTVPAIKPAVKLSKTKRIGILTTERTAKSRYQHKLIEEFASKCHVVTVGTNRLVPLIERGDRQGIRDILPGILEPFAKGDVDVIVLGCTHYPLIREEIVEALGKSIKLIDSCEAIARRTGELLSKKSGLAKEKIAENRFFTTGFVDNCDKVFAQLSKNSFKSEIEKRRDL